MLYEISLNTASKNCYRDITGNVESIIHSSGIKDGICLVFVPHTTAAVTVNEGYDESVMEDLLNYLSYLIPKHPKHVIFKHEEGNSDAHIKAALIGNSLALPISEGKLILGKWQRVMFLEFDGPRNRKVIVKVLGK